MPRSLSAGLQTQVSSSATKTAFLVELNLSSTVRLTDYYTDVTFDSNTYTAGGSFVTVDSTSETGQLKVDEVNIAFSNITDQVRTLVQSGEFTDKEVEIHLAYFDTNEDLVTYTSSNFDTLLQNLLFYSAASRTNYRIRYDIEGSGTDSQSISDNVSTPQTRGDAMVDTTLDASVRINDLDGDTYRSQQLPTGSPEVETTYTLKIYRK